MIKRSAVSGDPLPISSCKASNNQRNFDCQEAFDGVVTRNDNGWAYSGQVPASGEFFLTEPSTVNGLQILSGVGRSDHRIDDFEISLKTGGAGLSLIPGPWWGQG